MRSPDGSPGEESPAPAPPSPGDGVFCQTPGHPHGLDSALLAGSPPLLVEAMKKAETNRGV